MPSHAPRKLAPVKQLETLAKRKAALRKAVSQSFAKARIDAAAEHVRDAHLRVLKARLALLECKAESPETVQQASKISDEESRWTTMPVEQIIEMCNQDE